MKYLSTLIAVLIAAASALPVQADAHGHGHHRGGWGRPWVEPLVGTAILGGVVYAASTPRYVIAQPVIVVPQQPMSMGRTAYFCTVTQQYYPSVPTCAVPWQMVSF